MVCHCRTVLIMFFGPRCFPCCGISVCWRQSPHLFPIDYNADQFFSSESNIFRCHVVVDHIQGCGPSHWPINADIIREYVETGGVYIANVGIAGCDSNNQLCSDTAFNERMSLIGSSLRRGRGTASIKRNEVYGTSGVPLSSGVTAVGNSSAEIVNGIPVLVSVEGSACGLSAPGTPVVAAHSMGMGIVIGVGSGSMTLDEAFRNNILTLSPSAMLGNPLP